MRAIASQLGVGPLDLPWAEGPRLWRAEDIAAHLPLFKDYAPAAGLLAKAVLKATRCGGGLRAILGEGNRASRDTIAISIPRHPGSPAIPWLAHGNLRLAPHTHLCDRCCASPAKCRRQAIALSANLFAGGLNT
ncbi:MAG: hypothetical protein WBF43_00895 [Methylocella sp.]